MDRKFFLCYISHQKPNLLGQSSHCPSKVLFCEHFIPKIFLKGIGEVGGARGMRDDCSEQRIPTRDLC